MHKLIWVAVFLFRGSEFSQHLSQVLFQCVCMLLSLNVPDHLRSALCVILRGAWRDHCFPAPFSWFLHETGLESLTITSARCFSLKCQRKDSKKAKEYRQFCGVLGRWRTAAIDRTTFHACQRCRNTAVFAAFSRFWGVIWRVKAFHDQQWQFLTRNKSLRSENESNSLMTSECVCTDSILPRGAAHEHSRCKQSIFSLSIFGILVERLSF